MSEDNQLEQEAIEDGEMQLPKDSMSLTEIDKFFGKLAFAAIVVFVILLLVSI